MQFTLSAGGSPAQDNQSISSQAASLRTNATPKAAACTTGVVQAISSYVNALPPTESVSVSVSVGISHSGPNV
jgi:hypothetical protein